TVRSLLRFAALVATVAAALCAATSASPALIDGTSHGPACADILDGGVINPDFSPLQTLQFGIVTAKKSCSDVNYTLTVTYQTSSGPALVEASAASWNASAASGAAPISRNRRPASSACSDARSISPRACLTRARVLVASATMKGLPIAWPSESASSACVTASSSSP